MNSLVQKLEFAGHAGGKLAARLDLPGGPVRAYALFAHCFTCSKDLGSVRRIASELAREGIAVMRFDFTGLGSSEGEFASTNFSSNVEDLERAADYLRTHFEAPALLIGHSLGGAAVLSLADRISEARAVVTIGAPADAEHVLDNFGADLAEIERSGTGKVTLAGREFTIERQFVDDVRSQRILADVAALRKPLLIMHAPLDEVVGIENAGKIFQAATHPKSFVTLDTADHLLTDPLDAAYTGRVIAGWVSRYLALESELNSAEAEAVNVIETGLGKFQNAVRAGRHRLFADEPASVGGLGSGPSPYGYLSIALGACTAMTLRLYAVHKKLTLGRVRVDVRHGKIHASDCAECSSDLRAAGSRIDHFLRTISVDGEIGNELRGKLLEIADKCPVHRTLTAQAQVITVVEARPPA